MLGYISRQLFTLRMLSGSSSARTEVTDINFCTHKSPFTSLDQDDRNQEATELLRSSIIKCRYAEQLQITMNDE